MKPFLSRPLPGDIAKLRVNKTLHGRSVYRPANVPHHNVIRGYTTPGTGDAVDLFVEAGMPVRAMHASKITRIVEPTRRLGCVYLAGRAEEGSVFSVYAHIHVRPQLQVGDWIEEGTLLGYVNRVIQDPHLHLELWVNGKALSGRRPKDLRGKIAALILND